MRPVGVFAGSLTSAPPIGRDRTGIGRAGSMTQNELGVPICDSGNWETTLEQVLALGFRRGALAQQNLEILARRFGLISGEVETLEAVGNDLGITRERVRQIQTKALTYIERRIDSVKAYGALVSLIQQEIARRGGALGKEEVLALIHLGGQSPRYSPDMGVAFMLWISPLIIKLPRSARNRWTVYGSNDGASQLLTITGRIHEHLRRTGPLERDRLIGEIASDGPDRGNSIHCTRGRCGDHRDSRVCVASGRAEMAHRSGQSAATRHPCALHRDCATCERTVGSERSNYRACSARYPR